MKHLKLVSILCFVAAAGCLFNMGCLGIDAWGRNFTAQHPEQNPLINAQNRDQALAVSKVFFFLEIPMIPLSLVGAVLNVMAGVKIRTGESKGLITLTALLNLIPCVFGCVLISTPLGIYMLAVLVNPEVKALFDTADPETRRRMLQGDAKPDNPDDPDDPEAF